MTILRHARNNREICADQIRGGSGNCWSTRRWLRSPIASRWMIRIGVPRSPCPCLPVCSRACSRLDSSGHPGVRRAGRGHSQGFLRRSPPVREAPSRPGSPSRSAGALPPGSSRWPVVHVGRSHAGPSTTPAATSSAMRSSCSRAGAQHRTGVLAHGIGGRPRGDRPAVNVMGLAVTRREQGRMGEHRKKPRAPRCSVR